METKLAECESLHNLLQSSALKERSVAVHEILSRNVVLLHGFFSLLSFLTFWDNEVTIKLAEIKRRKQQQSEKFDLLSLRRIYEFESNLCEVSPINNVCIVFFLFTFLRFLNNL